MATGTTDAGFEQRVTDRVAKVAETMGENVIELGRELHEEIADSIPELRGDSLILELLRASTESNVETFLHMARYEIETDEIRPPSAAVEYARRLAQRGISSNALSRAYRIGQRRVIEWAFAEIAREEPDARVAFEAARQIQGGTFAYIDKVAEEVVAEYETERERWLANRNTVRITTLAALLSGEELDLGAAERALGHRLRQNHLGAVLWVAESDAPTRDLRQLEQVLSAVGEAVGAEGHTLFVPQDRGLGWGWISLGRSTREIDAGAVAAAVAEVDPELRIALGTPGAAASGFCATHREALRAHAVALAAGERASQVTTYADPGVRAAALLAVDLTTTRELVATSLGPLAEDDEGAERLRETLLTFLGEKGSYLATAERVHLHKNTVKYRVDKAVELRGRPLDEDRFNLELALVACKWLGRSVLA